MEAILNALIPVSFIGFLLAERFRPARPLPKVRFWHLKGIIFFFLGGAIFANTPLLFAPLIEDYRVLDLSGLGTGLGALVYLLAIGFVAYWYHRARHKIPALWRLHQMHHSAERLDVSGVFLHHPVDTFLVGVISTLSAGFLLGFSPEALAVGGFVGFLLEALTHANIRTPRWLGYIVQRPESHSIHHARGVHAFNYSFPIWDMVFGTFRNPEDFEPTQGFWDGASKELLPMLAMMDVTEPPTEKPRVAPASAPIAAAQ